MSLRDHGELGGKQSNTWRLLMKKCASHLDLTWKFALKLHVPITIKHAAYIVNRILASIVLVTLLLSLELSLLWP